MRHGLTKQHHSQITLELGHTPVVCVGVEKYLDSKFNKRHSVAVRVDVRNGLVMA